MLLDGLGRDVGKISEKGSHVGAFICNDIYLKLFEVMNAKWSLAT